MEISFELAHEDFWKYRKYRIAHDPLYIPTRFLSFYIFFFGISYLIYRNFALIAAASALVACVHTVRDLLTTKSSINRLISRNPYWILPQTVRLDEDGLAWVTDAGEVKIPWHQFVAVEDNGEYLLFRLRRWRAILVAKQAFNSPQEAFEFHVIAQSYWHNAILGSKRASSDNVWPPPPRIGTF